MLDLDHIERCIRNPSSASLDKEPLLALVAECRELRLLVGAPVVVDMSKLPPFDFKTAVESTAIPVPMPRFLAHDEPVPTPPAVVIDDRKPKRKAGK